MSDKWNEIEWCAVVTISTWDMMEEGGREGERDEISGRVIMNCSHSSKIDEE